MSIEINPSEHYRLATLCQLSYSSKREVEKQLKKLSYKTIRVIEWKNAFCFIAGNGPIKNIVIRGTDANQAMDWFRDADARLNKNNFHTGVAMYSHDLAEIEEHVFSGDYLTISGHSLGGASSVFWADRLSDKCNVESVVTFGQPKVCGKSFAKRFERKEIPLIRWVNDQDIVACIPNFDFRKAWNAWSRNRSIYLTRGYVHLGYPVYLDGKSNILSSKPWKWSIKERITDHYMENYVNQLKDLSEGKP